MIYNSHTFIIFVPSSCIMTRPIHVPSFINQTKQAQMPTAAYQYAISKVRQLLVSYEISNAEIDRLGFEPKYSGFYYDEHNKNEFNFTGFRFAIKVSGPNNIISRIPID